jgi:hypothetical protein
MVAGGLPHTRGTTIVFAGGDLPPSDEALQRLLLHELHHILSRHQTGRLDAYYRILGFAPCELVLTEELTQVRLTNPDAPTYDHYLAVDAEGHDGVVPFIHATGPYQAGSDTALPDYLGFGLLPVAVEGGTCTPVAGIDGLLTPQDEPAFLKAIGRNTNYIIHPEETLADNFVIWALGGDAVPDPEIPTAIGRFWSATNP